MDSLRIANCSGFYGDRLSAAAEMATGGPIDFLTGDYLAELTMALLWRIRRKDPDGGYARSFLRQMEEVMGTCLDRGIRVVANAGGLNPDGLADALAEVAGRLGLAPVVATVAGDDLMGRLDELDLRSFADRQSLAESGIEPVTANAYLGCWGIASALDRGADIVVTGRVTDAALVMGPAAHHFRWDRGDWDQLAGALVAGHVIECGTQCTGGNYSFFREIDGLDHIGFPLVEIEEDGSFVVTKHPGTGGAVTTETVTAQLLYEIGGHRYASPDVTARFDTIRLAPDGRDRVRVAGVVGEAPPGDLKVALNHLGGFRNRVTFVLTGLDLAEKEAAVESALWASLGGRESFADTAVQLVGDTSHPQPGNVPIAQLVVTVKDPDADKVGRRFSGAAVELALASYPGFFLTEPPGDAVPYGVYWPAAVAAVDVPARVSMAGETWLVDSHRDDPGSVPADAAPAPPGATATGPTVHAPLGRVAGARSGDKGGDANVGVWVRKPEAFGWLADTLTTQTFRRLVPEAADLEVERHLFENLAALNFVVRGLLGEGVASSTRFDAQAKALGEQVRAGFVDIPEAFLS